MLHWIAKAAIMKFRPTLLNVYFFRKVIKKPKPMNIIT